MELALPRQHASDYDGYVDQLHDDDEADFPTGV
jgi:hypothetical protein